MTEPASTAAEPSRVVLFGATGYTGRLVAEAMVERGMRPVLAARSEDKLAELADDLGGGLETRAADVEEPQTIGELVGRGDVLVSTVGPFVRFGAPAVAAAATHGAHYLDSTGEPPFIREVFQRYGDAAEKGGCGLLTAFGYDFVPGNLAGALALERAGDAAVRVDVGYFFTGQNRPSGGTLSSLAGVVTEEGFAYRDGRVQAERAARHARRFQVGSKDRGAISVGGSEHFALPRIARQLEEVRVYLGWFGPVSRALPAMSLGGSVMLKLPGVRNLWDAGRSRFIKGSTGGPDEEERSRGGSHIVGIAYDAGGDQLSEVHVSGVNGYTFTGRILAWGAQRAATAGPRGTGALGPVDAFGLRELEQGCAEAGLTVEDDDGGTRRKSAPEAAREPAKTGA
ncbi:MAG TPA: saccharopine dehydrogenase NADP-binding domain-containing protein [Thermoleophilaceae bacterium]|nr:saccharopine dehydrogenase NADP-binding domain-containing protein [Thermoleophilaceae bacterium]